MPFVIRGFCHQRNQRLGRKCLRGQPSPLGEGLGRHNQTGSKQGHLPGGPPNTKPGPAARQPPASLHGPAPAQDVARRILGSPWWAGFTFIGITAYGDGHDSLIGGDELSDGERDALLELCRQRLDAFREQCGEEVFAHRRGRFVLIAGAATATHVKASLTCDVMVSPALPARRVVNDLLTLPLAQRLELVQTLWDSIAAEQIGPELTETDRQVIDQRLEQFLASGDPGLDADAVLDALEQSL